MIYINSEWNIFPLWFMAKAFFSNLQFHWNEQWISHLTCKSYKSMWPVEKKITGPCHKSTSLRTEFVITGSTTVSLCGPTSIYCRDDVFNGVVAMVRVFLVLMPCYKRVLCKDTTRVTKHCLLYKLVPKDV